MENFTLGQAWAWPWVGVGSSFLPRGLPRPSLLHPTHEGEIAPLPSGRTPDALWQGQVWADKGLPAEWRPSQMPFSARQEIQQRPTLDHTTQSWFLWEDPDPHRLPCTLQTGSVTLTASRSSLYLPHLPSVLQPLWVCNRIQK